jgi:hypothetical protein
VTTNNEFDVIGWGRNTEKSRTAMTGRKARIQVVSEKTCNDVALSWNTSRTAAEGVRSYLIDKKTQICYSGRNSWTCNGDSGSVFFTVSSDSRPVVSYSAVVSSGLMDRKGRNCMSNYQRANKIKPYFEGAFRSFLRTYM